MLKASPNNSDDEDATAKVGNLFASFKAKTPTSADASTPGKISVASEIRQVLPLLLHVVLLHNHLCIVYINNTCSRKCSGQYDICITVSIKSEEEL